MRQYDFGIGIDPGTTHSGLVIVDLGSLSLVSAKHVENEDLIKSLKGYSLPSYRTKVGIERVVSYGQGIGNATIMTAEWSGRIYQCAMDRLPCENVTMVRRPDVKVSLCGSTTYKSETGAMKGVTDTMMKGVVMDLFPQTGGGGKPAVGTKKQPGPLFDMPKMKDGGDHCWSALLVLFTALRVEGLLV